MPWLIYGRLIKENRIGLAMDSYMKAIIYGVKDV